MVGLREKKPLVSKASGAIVAAAALFTLAWAPFLWFLLLNYGFLANPERNSPPPSGASMAGAIIFVPLLFNWVITAPLGFKLLKKNSVAGKWLVVIFGLIWFLTGIAFFVRDLSFFAPGFPGILMMVCGGGAAIYYLTRKRIGWIAHNNHD